MSFLFENGSSCGDQVLVVLFPPGCMVSVDDSEVPARAGLQAPRPKPGALEVCSKSAKASGFNDSFMMFYEFFMSFIMFYPLRFLSSSGDFLEFGLDCCGMRWHVLLFFLAGNYLKTHCHSL